MTGAGGAGGAAAHVLSRVRAAAGSRAQVELYGSCVYAPAHASDIDVLVSHAESSALARALGFALLPTLPPRLHGTIDGVAVDITVVNGDDDLARRMRSGPRDAAQLAAKLREHGRDEVFQAAWPHVRQLVRTRALGHNGLGWFGSFGWALLLAIPLVTDPALRTAAPGAALPAWLAWLSRLALGARVDFDADAGGGRGGSGAAASGGRSTRDLEPAPLFLAAPSPPLRDVARLSKRAAGWLFTEARAAALASAAAGASTDAAAVACMADIAMAPPPGTTLVISGADEHSRGRYDGTARALLRELEALCAARSWGRFDVPAAADSPDPGAPDAWEHRITVPSARHAAALALTATWLATSRLDAAVE